MTPYVESGHWRGRNWLPIELEVVQGFAEAVVEGRYRSGHRAVGDCREALESLRRGRFRVRHALRPRSQFAVQNRLGAVIRSLGIAVPHAGWHSEELRIVERYARAFVRGRYSEQQDAYRECWQALKRARQARPSGYRVIANRSPVAVREKLKAAARRLGGRTSRRTWADRELRLLEGYVRAVVRGKYETARAAAADYVRDIGRLRMSYPKAAWLASRHSPLAVANRLRDRAHALGLPASSAPWLREEERLLDSYARALVRGDYRNGGDAARALLRKLRGLPKTEVARQRNYGGVHSMLLSRAQELGRPFLALPWSPGEQALADSYARRLGLGEFRNAWEAAEPCARDLDVLRREHPRARWARMNRTTLGIWAQIRQRADDMGLQWTESVWEPAEVRIASRYARGVVLGRYPNAKSAAPECSRELQRYHQARRRRKLGQQGEPGPRTLRAVCGKIEAQTRTFRQSRRRVRTGR